MKLLIIFFLLPVQIYSQDISGLWSGYLYNDSTRKYLPYELTISENKDKSNGYSHVIILIDSIENVAIKTVHIKKRKGKIFVEDEAFIYNNFIEQPPKGVRVFSNMTYRDKDGLLSGEWKTNRTKEYNSLTGSIRLQKQKDLSHSKLIARLDEFDLSNTLSFLFVNKEKDISGIVPEPAREKKSETVSIIKEEIKDISIVPVKEVPPDLKPKPVTPIAAAVDLTKRKTEAIRSVLFKSDSLVISLYDNGDIDGDTVSVVMNGKVIMARQGLSANAITKTIYLTPDLGDSLQLVMYAENLGSVPPNSGLLILQDGNERHEIRFAGDFQKNSAITLRRKR